MRSESKSVTAVVFGAVVLGMGLISGTAAAQGEGEGEATPAAQPAAEPAPAPETAPPAEAPPTQAEPPAVAPEPVDPATAPPDAAPAPVPSSPPPATEPPPAQEQPRLQLKAQEEIDPLPSGPRTMRRHDGFYLRSSFGLGPLWGDFDLAEAGEPNLKASGSSVGFDLLIGGSPNPGFALGGGVMASWLLSADFEQDGDPVEDRTLTSGLLGVFVDGFPSDVGGWHLGALVGAGVQNLDDDGDDDTTIGVGGSAWGGYDQWVADDFSVGGLMKFTAIRSSGDSDTRAGSATLSFMFSALYH